MATNNRKTSAQRAAETQALHDKLTAQVEALTRSDEWMRFLKFAGSFHAYSFNNLILILAQRPDASQVAGFRKWQELGRQVRKGERGIKIFGFSTKKVTAEDPDTGEETTRKIPRFPLLTVFDITQTDPIDDSQTVEHPARGLTGTGPDGVWEAVTAWLVDEGWTVTQEPIAGAANGYTLPRERKVIVDNGLSDAQAIKTLLHEAAHVVLHEDLASSDYHAHRGIWETEAESVAYVLAAMAGLDTSAYSVGYVATWAQGDTDVLRDTAARVLAAVHTLASVVEPADAEQVA